MQPSRRPRVLLADDHTVVAEGARAILSRDFELVGVARDGHELLALAESLRPDAIVLDIAMPLLNGIEAAARLKKTMPGCPVVVMTGHDSPAYVRAALRAGATGYVLKAAAEELPEALHRVLMGKVHLPAQFAVVHSRTGEKQFAPELSPREREILQLIAEGKAAKEIAALTGLSPRTVEFHKYNVMKKLNLRTTAELTRYAMQEGLIPEV